jgi:hypothetical protein
MTGTCTICGTPIAGLCPAGGRPMVCLRGPLTEREDIPHLTPPVQLGDRLMPVLYRTTADSDGL